MDGRWWQSGEVHREKRADSLVLWHQKNCLTIAIKNMDNMDENITHGFRVMCGTPIIWYNM